MRHLEFAGNIATRSRAVVESVLRRWLGVDVVLEESYGAYEMTFEDGALDLYCHSENPATAGIYLLEGVMDGEVAESVDRLRSLADICREDGLTYQIDYTETDGAGRVIGEERTILANMSE